MFRGTAHVYDLLYEAAGKDYAAESAALTDVLRARNPRASSLLDVACGTGGHLRHLRSAFDEVAGVDIDSGMLQEARAALPDVTLVEGDMRTFDLGRRFDAVVCLFSSIGYVRSTAELGAAVGRMGAHLAPGGVLVVDAWLTPDQWREPGRVHVLAGERDGVAAARVGRTRRAGRTTVLELHHLVAAVDTEGVEHIVDLHELTLFEREEYEAAFRQAGLEPQRLPSPLSDRDRYAAVAPG